MDAATVTALGAAVAVILAALTGLLVALTKVHAELKTLNEGTVGTFASDDETRRVEVIPHDERTPTEQRHLDEAPPKEAAQGPSIRARTEAIYEAVNGKPPDQPTLYEIVATLDLKVDHAALTAERRFDRLERLIGGGSEPQ